MPDVVGLLDAPPTTSVRINVFHQPARQRPCVLSPIRIRWGDGPSLCHTPESEYGSELADCLVEPSVWVFSQTLVVGQYMAKLMGKLVCKFAPVFFSCLEKDWVWSFWRETIYRYWLVVKTFRRRDLNSPTKGFPDQLSEMGSDILQQHLNVVRLGITPVALGY